METSIQNRLDNLVEIIKEEALVDSKFIAARPPGPKTVSSEPIIFSDELKYLNQHWNDWSVETNFSSHRSFFGKLIVLFKRKIQKYVFEVFFKEYFDRERVFSANLVRFLNLTAQYIDKRHEDAFYGLIKKVDTEVNLINSRNDEIFSVILQKIDHPNAK